VPVKRLSPHTGRRSWLKPVPPTRIRPFGTDGRALIQAAATFSHSLAL
jgi:hypothetical protein